jgi:hypothetical protein
MEEVVYTISRRVHSVGSPHTGVHVGPASDRDRARRRRLAREAAANSKRYEV